MSMIQEYLEKIRLARYGKDVRQSIHDAIHQCYEDGKAGSIDLVAREFIDALQEDINSKTEKMEIATTTSTTIQGTKPGGFRLTKFVANTTQNGTPSPSTPFPLLSTGDCVEFMKGYWKGNTGTHDTALPYTCCTKNKIPCKSGDIIKINTETKYSIAIVYYNASGGLNGEALASDTTSAEFTVPSNASYFHVDIIDYTYVMRLETVGKITLTINGKYVTCIKTQGKNFANPTRNTFVSRLGGAIASKTGFDYVATGSGTAQVVNMYIPIKENTDYAFSFKDKGYINSFGLTFVDSIGAWTNITNKVNTGNSENHKYALLSWQLDAGYTGTISVYDIQLEVGTVATDFEEYRETTAYILTNEPPRLGDVVYKENGLWKLEHNSVERTFTVDNANWKQSTASGQESVFFTQTYKNDYIYPQYPLCDMFSPANGYATVENGKCSIDTTGSFWLCNTDFNTLDGFKAWITEKPIKVQYKLATPTIETLDTQSQIALNGLETFEGVTHVEFDTRVQPLEFEAEVGLTNETARLLKNELRNDTLEVKYNELAVAMVSL